MNKINLEDYKREEDYIYNVKAEIRIPKLYKILEELNAPLYGNGILIMADKFNNIPFNVNIYNNDNVVVIIGDFENYILISEFNKIEQILENVIDTLQQFLPSRRNKLDKNKFIITNHTRGVTLEKI